MTDWNIYGSVVRVYKGSGDLHSDDSKISCEFELVQLANGDLCASCQVLGPYNHLKAYFMAVGEHTYTLIGKTNDGQQLTFFENLIAVSSTLSSSGDSIIIYGKFLDVKSLENRQPFYMKFALTNLIINPRQIEVNFNDCNFVIKPVENYNSTIASLKASNGVALTSEAIISLNSVVDQEKAINIIQDVCLLLSLSQGCRISWLYYDVIAQDEKIIASFHGSSITKPFTNLPLILREDTVAFLENVYPNLLEQKEPWKLQKAIDAFIDAKVTGDFLEARALKMVILLEHLKASYSKEKDKVYILNPPKVFDDSVDGLIKDMKQLLISKFPDLKKDELNMMAGHVQGLNWVSFSNTLSKMCEDIKMPVNSKDRRRFIQIRNELVHRFEFHANYGTPWQQYSYLMDFIGKMLLAILKYDGYYYDWTKLEKDQDAMRTKFDLKKR